MRRTRTTRHALLASITLLLSCGGGSTSTESANTQALNTQPPGTQAVNTNPTSTRPTSTDSSGVWLPLLVEHTPTVKVSFSPERLWFWALLGIGSDYVMLQGDDNGNSWVTAVSEHGEQWKTAVSETMGLAVLNGVVLVTVNSDEAPDGVDLIGISADDGSIRFTTHLDGYYMVQQAGSDVLLIDDSSEALTVARVDPTTFAVGTTIRFPHSDTYERVDQGLLAWNGSRTMLISIGSMTSQEWASGSSASPNLVSPTTAGDTLIHSDSSGALSGIGPDGQPRWSAKADVGTVTAIWSPDVDHVLVAGSTGLELFLLSANAATSVASQMGTGRLGPTAVIDGTAHLVWYHEGRGSVVRLTPTGFDTVGSFAAEEVDPENDSAEQATFVDNALYLTTHITGAGAKQSVGLTAYSLSDMKPLWTLESESADELEAFWLFQEDVIVLLYGYALIPSYVSVYR